MFSRIHEVIRNLMVSEIKALKLNFSKKQNKTKQNKIKQAPKQLYFHDQKELQFLQSNFPSCSCFR